VYNGRLIAYVLVSTSCSSPGCGDVCGVEIKGGEEKTWNGPSDIVGKEKLVTCRGYGEDSYSVGEIWFV